MGFSSAETQKKGKRIMERGKKCLQFRQRPKTFESKELDAVEEKESH